VTRAITSDAGGGDGNGDTKSSDLSVTALYTAGAWAWGALPDAELFASADTARVFRVVNAALAVARFLRLDAAPLAPSLLHRHAAIDHLLRASRSAHVLELAAGLSRRGITFSSDASVTYIEVDRPSVIAKKRALLERSSAGRDALSRANLRLVSGDVTTLAFDELCPPDGAPLFVIAEGLAMYLTRDAQRALFRAVSTRLARGGGGRFVFDLVPPCEQPAPGRVGRALEWLMKKFTGGRSFERDARTRGDVIADLVACGFGSAFALEPRTVAHAWGLPHPDVVTQQLLFIADVPAVGDAAPDPPSS
jgi:O-methyltransferase involved in polyketide biosynthesis